MKTQTNNSLSKFDGYGVSSGEQGAQNTGSQDNSIINLPKGGGAIKSMGETFQANLFKGTGGYSIPVPVSKSRFSPSLEINYNSGNGNSVFGIGFSTPVSKVARRTDKHVPKYNHTDTFVIPGVGELVPKNKPVQNGIKEFDTRHKTYTKIEFIDNSYWKLTSTGNVVTIYGRKNKIVNPYNQKTFEWLTDETYDDKGNLILYNYKPDGNNLYLHCVEYGNQTPYDHRSGTLPLFLFQIIFDYGENYVCENGVIKALKDWNTRSDIFRKFNGGFDLETKRLCYRVLNLHNFKTRILTKELKFEYDENKTLTSLKTVFLRGHYKGKYKDTPKTNLLFSQFKPNKSGKFEKLKLTNNISPQVHIRPINLKGQSIPGLFYNDLSSVLYFPPCGHGRFSFPPVQIPFPLNKHAWFQSLDANGKLQIVQKEGYYEDGRFHKFETIPTSIDPNAVSLSTNSNGLQDIISIQQNKILIYESKGKKGYTKVKTVSNESGVPYTADSRKKIRVTGNFFGDGLQHLALIKSGSVKVWPNLGKGKFGKPISIKNAPKFDDTKRILFGDLDGSGTLDMMIMHSNKLQIFRNQSGNSFATTPIELRLPERYSDQDHILFADILGNGTTSLVFSKMGVRANHYYFDFTGCYKDKFGNIVPAMKPYLLNQIDNNSGAITQMHYCSSTKFYLEKKDLEDICHLPFPVQVVEKVIAYDEISRTKATSQYQYYYGHFDYDEREFCGFGRVEHIDTEDYINQKDPDLPTNHVEKQFFAPPVKTISWHNVGCNEQKQLLAKYKAEYYKKDKQAYDMPGPVFENITNFKQACFALRSSVLRSEVYSLDNSPNADHPYVVSQSNVKVKEIQKSDPYNIYEVTPCESISYHYERNADDPKVEQNFTLEIDEKCGKPTKACKVILPRRKGRDDGQFDYTDQYKLRVFANKTKYVTACSAAADDSSCFANAFFPYEEKSYFVKPDNLHLNNKGYMTFEECQKIKTYLQTDNDQKLTILKWDKHYFYKNDMTGAMPLGKLPPLAPYLTHHSESAVFKKDKISDIYQNKLYLKDVTDLGGYIENDGFIWACSMVPVYYGKDKFYLPHTNKICSKVPKNFIDNTKIPETKIHYDQPYYLFPINSQTYFTDKKTLPNGVKPYHETKATIDYDILKPCQVVDINGNVSQILFDPLEQVIVSSHFKPKSDGTLDGGMVLFDYTVDSKTYKAQYKKVSISQNDDPDKIIKDIMDNPEKYLQGGLSFFYYDLFAYAKAKQPLWDVGLTNENFYNNGNDFLCKAAINYSDGFGRSACAKLKGDFDISKKPGEPKVVSGWATSNKVVYNNKGKVIKSYLPYYSKDFRFEDLRAVGEPVINHYDPVGRVVRVDMPKGFFSKVEFTPWEIKHYDLNDTVLDSDYYKKYSALPLPEKDALDKAAKCYNTPGTAISDNMGNTIYSIADNLGNITIDTFVTKAGLSKSEAKIIFEKLTKNEYIAKGAKDLYFLTNKFRPYTKNFVREFEVKYSKEIFNLLLKGVLTTKIEYDEMGRAILVSDPRLYLNNINNINNEEKHYYNFKHKYCLDYKKPLYVFSNDCDGKGDGKGGGTWSFVNILGQVIKGWNSRGFVETIQYDKSGRMINTLLDNYVA